MRNLKKILALVLALMMVLSVMVTASAASFTDADEINADYAEAVEVLSGIGVIEGFKNADGTYDFRPEDTLTRAQAAKIISYILVGDLEEIAELAEGVDVTFTDVPSWALPYVAYCYSEGIIVGRNATTYDPNGEVTGFEFGKMLLIAAGICEAKDFADDWKVTVSENLKTAEIWAGASYDFSLKGALTREQACYLAFNAMNYATESTYGYAVIYDGNNADADDDYVMGHYPTLVEAATAASVLGDKYTYATTKTTVTNNSLAASVFGLDTVASLEGIGYEGYYWYVNVDGVSGYNYQKDALVSGFICTDTIVGTFTKANAEKEVVAALGKTTDVIGTVYANGVKDGTKTLGAKSNTKVETDSDVTLTVAIAADKTVKLMYAREYLTFASRGAKVTEKTSAYYGQYAWSFTTPAGTVVASVYGAADAYNTYVGYLVVPTDVPSITVAETVVGLITGIAANTYLRVNSTSVYYLSDATADDNVVADSTLDKTYKTVYLNTAGDVIYVGGYSAAATVYDGYAYVAALEYIATPYSATGLVGTGSEASITAKATIVTPAGETAIVDVATTVEKEGSTYNTYYYLNGWVDATEDRAPHADKTVGAWYAYTLEDGAYAFDTMSTSTITGASTKGATLNVEGVKHYMDANTVISIVKYNTSSKAIETSSVTGYANINAQIVSALTNAEAVVVADPVTKVISSITIYDTTSTTASVDFAVYKGLLETSSLGAAYNTYGFYVNGELKGYNVTADISGLVEGDIVTFVTNDRGVVTTATKVSDLSGTYTVYSGITVKAISADGTYLINAYGNIYTLAPGYVVYDTPANGYAVAELGVDQTITAITVNDAVVAIFITAHPAV